MNEEVTEAKLEKLREAGIEEFKILFIDGLNVGSYLRDTLLAEKVKTTEDAIMEIYRRLRPGDPPTLETAKTLFHNLFFNPERYDLSKVGRLKLNYKFYRDLPEDQRPALDTAVLTPQDILETVRHLIELKNGRGSVDDIDHLGNRRVRAVGELMENQYRIGLVRMERAIKERMSMSQEIDTLMPHDLINAKPVERGGQGVLRQLAALAVHGPDEPAQRGDAQASPLARSGPAVSRASAPASRCATSTRPTTAASARSRRRKVRTSASSRRSRRSRASTSTASSRRRTAASAEGKVTDDVAWYSALEEEGKYIAQASANIDEKGKFRETLVSARLNGDFHMVTPDMIQLMDVAPNQMVCVAAALVPVPRARRREPRAHGREHAAPGRAAHPQPRAVRRHRAWKASSRATPASARSPGATASSRASTRRASSSVRTATSRRSRTSTR